MISVLKTNGERAYEITTYVIDTIDDLKDVPKVHIGDNVYIISVGEWKILSSDGEWKSFISDLNIDEL